MQYRLIHELINFNKLLIFYVLVCLTNPFVRAPHGSQIH